MATRKVLRVYDKHDKYANTGECYFLVLPTDYDPENEWHYEEHIYTNIARIAGMSWQNYTSYMVGTADIAKDELYWSEITGYELHECKIDVARVAVTGRYKLPEELLA